ncbi:MAG: methyltransferase domain-containing protein [Nitrosopumilus sp.]|nr:methyltransferase domain-containing protein [Nitrosopumilus sp.]CAI9830681.1 Methyltransferase type 11 [Nitrosopumilaceae archaeon]MDA7953539.1 methyltransferase domain-containing protein [Nitrosopumilus sp.]MDA7954808.1 methyltransferase domain-containing protein [Nitrosopumilus sp.]MDA7958690.1 methyltransferase domain-containing protein [Nitrosopumilus sp.]
MQGGAAYKISEMASWDEAAPRYHRRWAGARTGPFQSTPLVVRAARIGAGDRVLDVACGTGAVTCEAARAAGPGGSVLGVDASAGALRIAARACRAPNVSFAIYDAENVRLGARFDAVTCQYALFFFPDARRALRRMRRHMAPGGRLGIAVHGADTPFYTSFLGPAAELIPGIARPGAPRLDRYGTRGALAAAVRGAGFSRVVVREHVFRYSPGTFEQYWRRYTRNAPARIREALRGAGRPAVAELRKRVREGTAPYTRGGRITFPWQVLVLSARR